MLTMTRTFKTNSSIGSDKNMKNPNPGRYIHGKISTSSSEERQSETQKQNDPREMDMYINVTSTKDKDMPAGPIKLSNFMQIKLASRKNKDAINKF